MSLVDQTNIENNPYIIMMHI